jgi:SOS-response transcriptional repressor LexA|tara:strand:+ start:137 stop:364 length:228 start_codon:yes stop_codon:yes gene_type:complete
MTPKQAKVLVALKDYWNENQYAPTYSEMAKVLKYKTANVVSNMVFQLAKKGYVTVLPNTARSIEITQKGKEYGKN